MSGKYKIWSKGVVQQWIYFEYRTTKGIMEAKQIGNRFAEWFVINSIPNGAILC